MTTPNLDIAAARELLRAATDGPWESLKSCPHIEEHDCGSTMLAATHEDRVCIRGIVADSPIGRNSRADFALIAHMRTAYPAALDALEKCRAALGACARVGRDLSPSVERQALYSEQNWKDAALDAGRRLARIAAAAISEAQP